MGGEKMTEGRGFGLSNSFVLPIFGFFDRLDNFG